MVVVAAAVAAVAVAVSVAGEFFCRFFLGCVTGPRDLFIIIIILFVLLQKYKGNTA